MDVFNILENQYISLILVPLLIGILEVIKKTEVVKDKFVPLISLLLGTFLGIAFTGFSITDGTITGMLIGLSAVGLYSGFKAFRE